MPNWKDLNPRFGIVWDPKGDAKTAIKFGINRYVQSATTGMAQPVRPGGPGNAAQHARTWTDSNGNRLPDCDLGPAGADQRLPAATSAARWPTRTSAA